MTDTIVVLLVFLLVLIIPIMYGVPVAFSLGFSTLVLMLLPIGPELNLALFPIRMFNAVFSFVLLAVPLYLFVGRLLNQADATEAIFELSRELIGPLRGGIGQINVVASLIFSGMSGSAIADAAGLGTIEFEMMKEAGYEDDLSLAITGSSAIIGPIIPPSIPLIIYGALAGVPVTSLFLAGIVPGFLMASMLMIFVYVYSRRRHHETKDTWEAEGILRATYRAFPALFTVVLILGGIFLGLFTATEAGGVAVFWAALSGFVFYDLNVEKCCEAAYETMIDISALLLIFAVAAAYSFAIIAAGIPQAIVDLLLVSSGDPTVVLFILVVIFLLLGMFLGPLVNIILFVPLLQPAFGQLGINPLHAGIVIVITLMIGLLTPPFGGILFVLERVTGIDILRISKAVIPFLLPLVITLVLIILFPKLVTFVPTAFG